MVATAVLGGCASRVPTLASRFVRQGEPAADLGGNAPVPVRHDASRRPGPQPIVEVSKYSSSLVSLEATDPRLRASLAALAGAPTLEHHLSVARAYHRLGVFDRAYDHLQLGAALDARNAAIHDAMARVWRDWGWPALGLSNAYRAVYTAPRSATARHTLGTLFHALGLRSEAADAFRETVALDPEAWYAWQNLCSLAMADGRTKDAIALCQRAAAVRAAASKRKRP